MTPGSDPWTANDQARFEDICAKAPEALTDEEVLEGAALAAKATSIIYRQIAEEQASNNGIREAIGKQLTRLGEMKNDDLAE
jgi:hypothetical protein